MLAVTTGDPCGIGPEVLLKALAMRPVPPATLIVIGDLRVFESTARRARLRVPSWRLLKPSALRERRRDPIAFLQLDYPGRVIPGQSSAQAGRASVAYLEAAVGLCRQGLADGLVTGPVTKWAIQRTHPRFQGQTEYLARAFGIPQVTMMFVSDRLRVALLTRHVALRDVVRHATAPTIHQTILSVADGLRRLFGIRRPRLAICGVNPHAGEAGHFGREEQQVLRPALSRITRRDVTVDGPFAADGFFAEQYGARSAHSYDAVLCWYHDQGLIPFKLLARDQGCQLTIGLPVVRTSPDHGSALELAGRGRAHPGSMRYALRLAATLGRPAS